MPRVRSEHLAAQHRSYGNASADWDTLPPRSFVRGYLLRHGGWHLLQAPAEDAAQQWHRLFSQPGWMHAKFAVQRFEPYVNDFVYAHHWLQQAAPTRAERLIDAFLTFALARFATGDWGVESLHALLVYRLDKRFYLGLLKRAKRLEMPDQDRSDLVTRSFRRCLANCLRRAGPGELAEARRLLDGCLMPTHSAASPEDLDELGRAHYEAGFVAFMRGVPDEALHHMQESARSAEIAERGVGVHISRCARDQIAWYFGRDPGHAFADTLTEAHDFFAALGESSVARRWLANIAADRFELAYEARDLRAAEAALRTLDDNTWLQEFDTSQMLTWPYTARLYEARLRDLEANPDGALELFEAFFAQGNFYDRPQVAREYLEWGRLEPDPVRSAAILRRGLAAPPDFANRPWQGKIKQALG